MIDFKDVTFIVPIRFDSEDRRNNFKTSMNYLLRNFDTNIIVLDSDKESNEEFVKSVSEKIKYVFEKNDEKLFHRTRLLNDMTKMAETEIIVNYDVDVIFPIEQYIESKKKIEEGCTMCFPYAGKFYDIPKKFFDLVDTDELSEIPLNQCTLFNPNSVGGAFFFHKSRYQEIGWENENFVSWGHEDWERIHRVQFLGYGLCRTEGVLYHLTHSRTVNSNDRNPFYQFNGQEIQRIKRLNKEQLLSEIKKWKWCNDI
jgi:predicted glycosyltransferase involved in capsule biosynthesis